MTDLNRETYASDVLEGWMPDLPDTHPDDCPRAFDDDGRPLLGCPMAPAGLQYTMRCDQPNGLRNVRVVTAFDGVNVRTDVEIGAIEGAGGTWWRTAGRSFSVSAPESASKGFRRWLAASKRRNDREPGETDQKTAPLRAAYKIAYATCNARGRHGTTERTEYREACERWEGIDATTGETVLTLFVPPDHARAIVDAYGVAGRPLVLRPA